MKKFEITFNVKGGNLTPLSRKQKDLLKQWYSNHEGKNVKAVFEVEQEGAHHSQYKYLYGYVYTTIQNELINCGYAEQEVTLDAIDTTFKLMFAFEEKLDTFTGELHKIPKSKRSMNQLELKEYTENVVRYCAENMGLEIASSDEYLFDVN